MGYSPVPGFSFMNPIREATYRAAQKVCETMDKCFPIDAKILEGEDLTAEELEIANKHKENLKNYAYWKLRWEENKAEIEKELQEEEEEWDKEDEEYDKSKSPRSIGPQSY